MPQQYTFLLDDEMVATKIAKVDANVNRVLDRMKTIAFEFEFYPQDFLQGGKSYGLFRIEQD